MPKQKPMDSTRIGVENWEEKKVEELKKGP